MSKFCPNCGSELNDDAQFCASCGQNLNASSAEQQVVTPAAPAANTTNTAAAGAPKSKLVAGLLALFLGSLGIHNFYLGYNQKAITQLVICLAGSLLCGLGAIVAAVWALVDCIYIFTGKIDCDAAGVKLTD